MDFLTRTHSIEKNSKRKNHHFSGPPSSHPLLPTSLAAAVSNEERQVRELELFLKKGSLTMGFSCLVHGCVKSYGNNLAKAVKQLLAPNHY